jgi:hypothetical protein
MFDELEKYQDNDHFFYDPTQQFNDVSNVPKDFVGIYLIYALERGRVNLVYTGTSLPEGPLAPKMLLENIEALDIYWYVTNVKGKLVSPEDAEDEILEVYHSVYGSAPRWNEHM